jgi:hypothetical protein
MKKLAIGLVFLFVTAPAFAGGLCDKKPSKLISSAGAAATAAAGSAVGSAGAAGSALGFYTLPHAASGLTMLASTAGGASAAGTVGIMGGTAGAIGATAAVVLNPFVWGSALFLAVGTVAFEGACLIAGE